MSNPTTISTAHKHAEAAESHRANGHLIPAAEEHFKAADGYLQASKDTNLEESTNRTLKMLHSQHQKAGLDLQRRIEKLKADGLDPSLPQKLDSPSRTSSSSRQPTTAPQHPSRPSSPGSNRTLGDSHAVDESFMLLGGQKSDPGDAFNHFWDIMQGMLDNLSQPVAFATIPLGSDTAPTEEAQPSSSYNRDSSLTSDTDFDEPKPSRFSSWRLGLSGEKKTPSRAQVQVVTPLNESDEDFDDDELSGSFYLIGDDASPQRLKKENTELKTEIDAMRKRLVAAERAFEIKNQKENQLRDSLLLASKEVQRAMGAGAVNVNPMPPRPGGMDLGSMNLNMPAVPIPGYNTAREAQYAKRVKELEEELRVTRVELDKTRADNLKHRERWSKVKESAKRKKEIKAASAAAQTAIDNRIVEEPEAEAAAEDAGPLLD